MTTVADQAEVIRRRLYSTDRGRYAKLASQMSATGTVAHLADEPVDVQVGSTVGCDQEIMLVRAVDKPSKTITVVRGFYGTEKATHGSGDAHLMQISPRFPYPDIVDTMVEEINSWPPTLFRPVTVTVNTSDGDRTYDVAQARTLLFGLDLQLMQTGAGIPRFPAESRVGYRIARRMLRSEYPSSFALQFDRNPGVGQARFTYATDFDTSCFETTTDLQNEVGLTDKMLPVLTYGVMWRLFSGRESGRADMHAAGETRKAEDVPAGLQTQITSAVMKLRDREMSGCALSLRSDWPYRVAG